MLCTLGSLKMLPCLLEASIIYKFLQIPTDIFISWECLFLICLLWACLSCTQKLEIFLKYNRLALKSTLQLAAFIFDIYNQVFKFQFLNSIFRIKGKQVILFVTKWHIGWWHTELVMSPLNLITLITLYLTLPLKIIEHYKKQMSDMIIIYPNKSICALLTNAGLSGSMSLPSTTPFSYICGRASIDLTAALFGVHSLGLHTALPQLTYSPHIRLSARYAL